jgi:hypothetical protein
VCRGVALPYDALFLGGEKSGMKAILLYRGINIKMDSTMMQYDQQHHRVGAQKKKKKKLAGEYSHTCGRGIIAKWKTMKGEKKTESTKTDTLQY